MKDCLLLTLNNKIYFVWLHNFAEDHTQTMYQYDCLLTKLYWKPYLKKNHILETILNDIKKETSLMISPYHV